MSNGEPKLKTILVVEDSPPNRKILVHLVNKLGFEVIECEDGECAKEKLVEAKSNDKKIDAILSDIMMPRKDGIQLLKELREDEEYKNTPFVLVSAVSDKEQILEAKKYDVNGYILKPVTFDRVLKKLKELFPDQEFPKLAG